MNWIWLALSSYLLLAIVFIIDKSLLKGRSVLASPWKYALASSLLALLTFLLLPWTKGVSFEVLPWLLGASVVHIAALGYFFTALRKGEVSVVVPLTGSISPLVTLLLAMVVMLEALAWRQGIGVVAVVVGAWLLSFHSHTKAGIPKDVMKYVVAAGMLFAVYFVIMKEAYAIGSDFLSVFVYSRLLEGALAVLAWIWLFGLRLSPRKKKRAVTDRSWGVWGLFGAGKVLAAIAFFLQHVAVSQGSVVIVNGLQGTQYLFLLVGAVLLSQHWPRLLQEEFGRVVMGKKIIGVLLIAIGVTLLV